MESFAEQIKRLRKEKRITLREASARLKIDKAILSKIENGKRIASRKVVSKLARYFRINENDLVISWLSDKLVYETENESVAIKAFKVAEEKIAYKKSHPLPGEKIIGIIRDFLEKDGRVSKAWIFGSFAREGYNISGDIDLMVKFKDPSKTSLFDYADISYLLEQRLNIKIDLVEEGYLQPFALKTAQNDLRVIYEQTNT